MMSIRISMCNLYRYSHVVQMAVFRNWRFWDPSKKGLWYAPTWHIMAQIWTPKWPNYQRYCRSDCWSHLRISLRRAEDNAHKSKRRGLKQISLLGLLPLNPAMFAISSILSLGSSWKANSVNEAIFAFSSLVFKLWESLIWWLFKIIMMSSSSNWNVLLSVPSVILCSVSEVISVGGCAQSWSSIQTIKYPIYDSGIWCLPLCHSELITDNGASFSRNSDIVSLGRILKVLRSLCGWKLSNCAPHIGCRVSNKDWRIC